MGELAIEIQELRKEVSELKQLIHENSVLMMKDKVNTTWVDEEVAAAMIGYHPETLRRKVKEGARKYEEPWCLITFRNTRGRNWQYSRKSLVRFQERTSIGS